MRCFTKSICMHFIKMSVCLYFRVVPQCLKSIKCYANYINLIFLSYGRKDETFRNNQWLHSNIGTYITMKPLIISKTFIFTSIG